MGDTVRVRELAAWGFDASKYRPACDVIGPEKKLAARDAFVAPEDVVELKTFAEHAGRADLIAEMEGLDWSLGLVDLRGLIAFQRRVVFDPAFERDVTAESLLDVAFGPPVPLTHKRRDKTGDVVIETANPNLQLRPVSEGGPLALHGGSPFFEVAEFRGRWFLRDGYHRAYALLRAGIMHLPAVIVRARNLAELGPVGEWFFQNETLFAERPPFVTDFLDDELTIEYTRPRLLKTIRIRVEESFAPALTEVRSGEEA